MSSYIIFFMYRIVTIKGLHVHYSIEEAHLVDNMLHSNGMVY